MRPFFPYYGSKWNIARYYPAPTHEVVIEPFAGSAGYSTFYKCPRVRLYDADPIIACVWDYLLNVSAEEIASIPEMPNAGDHVDDHPLPPEAKWLIGFWLNRGSATPKKSRTAYSARSDRGQLNWGPRAKARIIAQLPLIADWTITEGAYDDAPNWEATWFVDPPYQDKGKYYRVPFREYDQLADWSRRRLGQLIVCEGPGATWLPFEPLGSFKSTKGRANEVVYVAETWAGEAVA